MVLVTDIGGGEIGSFVIQLRFLYRNKQFSAFETQVIWKIKELLREGTRDSLMRMYCHLDPVYQLLYFEIKMKTAPISRKLQKVIETASLPLYKMSEEVRENYLLKLEELLS
jgi:hypothetical protein